MGLFPNSVLANHNRRTAVALCAVFVSFLHFAMGSADFESIAWHMVFNKLYFLPVLLGAVWFGVRGGLAAASGSAALYALHLWWVWPKTEFDLIGHVGESLSFFALGGVSGLLVSQERAARDRALRTERKAEREKILAATAALTESLSARDPQTSDHSRRVAALAAGFAEFLGLPALEVKSLHLAGLLHDIGKIGIPDDILLKAETLSPEERARVMEHPDIGRKILAPIGFQKVVDVIAAHHENVDGTGYPRGLKASEIPYSGKILAIADTYDALASSRPYKEALAEEEIEGIMNRMAGYKLDPGLLEKFWEFTRAGKAGLQ